MSRYFIMEPERNMDYCVIGEIPDNMPNIHYPSLGKKMGNSYPDDVKFQMSDDFPGLRVADLIRNSCGYTMVSARLRKVLEEHAIAEIEFLRFTLLNHKGRVASHECYIANVLGTVDCVDKDRTKGEVSKFKPERYDFLESLYLKEEKIDPNLNLFRVTSFPRILIIREDLKTILNSERMTGWSTLTLGATVNLES